MAKALREKKDMHLVSSSRLYNIKYPIHLAHIQLKSFPIILPMSSETCE
jgi:hypothetical protein